MFRGHVLLLAGILSGLMLGGMSSPSAQAQATARLSPPKPADAPATATLREDGVGTNALRPNCYGQTDRPHRSSHVLGNVNVVARTVCPGHSVYVSTALYRDRWYGQQFLDDGANRGYSQVKTNAAWRCAGTGTYTYRAYSYHEATGGGWARTANSARFNC